MYNSVASALASCPPPPGGACAVDPSVLATMCTGKPELLRRLVKVYRDYAPKLVADMRSHMDAGNPGGLRMAAHSLKSSSANVGAARLAEHCRAIETAAAAGRLGECAPLVAAVGGELPHVDAALAALAA